MPIKIKARWELELAEYRRLLAEQMTGSHETDVELERFIERQKRINQLYLRLY